MPRRAPDRSAQAASNREADLQVLVAAGDRENAELRRERDEAREQQAATAEILRVISSTPPDLQRVLETILEHAARLCGAENAIVYRPDGDRLRTAASRGPIFARAAARPLPSGHGAIVPGWAAGRAWLERKTIHIPDIEAESDAEYPVSKESAGRVGWRTLLVTPLMRDEAPIGVISLSHARPRPFSDHQIALVETFADQAVIAIENARLFQELQERLEEQTATAEILRVIAESPADIRRVLDAIAECAARLCRAPYAGIQRVVDDQIRVAGVHLRPDAGVTARAAARAVTVDEPRGHITERSASGRALRQLRTVHTPDMAIAVESDYPDSRDSQRQAGYRTTLAVPLVRGGVGLGIIALLRFHVQPFSDREIALAESLASQAVIAIENARLFTELNESNAGLREALEQQTATAQVLEAISRAPTDLQAVLDTICASAGRLCGGVSAIVSRVEADAIRRVAVWVSPGDVSLVGGPPLGEVLPLDRAGRRGQAVRERRTVYEPDLQALPEGDPRQGFGQARRAGVRAMANVPLLRGGEAVGVLGVYAAERDAFTDQHLKLLETFADQAVIAIENARLFAELQERLEEQTATSEILRVISESPTALPRVLEAIAASAARLCQADSVAVRMAEGDTTRVAARHGRDTPSAERRARALMPIDRTSVSGRAMVDRRTVHVEDISAAGAEYPRTRALAREDEARTYLATPLLRSDAALGVIFAIRYQVRPFAPGHIRLLESFADQAVIAIENARLFSELQQRTQDLSRSFERLTALFEVGQAVASTLDLDRLLQTVVARAAGLAGADGGAVYEYDPVAGAFDLRATDRMDAALVAAMREARVGLGESVVGQAGQRREPVQVADILAEGHGGPTLRVLRDAGYRAVLAVPLLRENAVVGALVVRRREPGAFDADTVALLQTFATQSALAIQNARLFAEIEQKSRQLEQASQHKSEFLANMSHELRTPLNAVIGFTEVLLERYFGDINEKQEDYLRDVLSSGQHLLSLINDILDLSKVEAGRMELELATFDLGPVLEAGLVMVGERASRKGVEVSLEAAPDVGRVEADERKVKQVLFNLLTNAVKFTPEGGTVTVSARQEDGCVEMAVNDTGVGIAPEDQARVFEEFGQARSAAGQSEGTGLGLALCKRFVELHGGTIAVASEVGRGSTFTVSLPVRQPTPPGGPPGQS